MKWKVLESEYIFNEPWLTVRKEKCQLPDGTLIPSYYTVEYPTWVTVFAVTKDYRVVMVRQYRHGLGVMSIETAGGVVDPHESIEEAAKRELKEETGYDFDKFEYLGKISANPATTNNYMHMYLATGGEKTGDPKMDATEQIEVLLLTMQELKQLVMEHGIVQALHLACVNYALLRLGEISY